MKKYLDWQIRPTTWITLVAALLSLCSAFVLPDGYGDKNSPVENIQMLVLLVGICVTSTAKVRRKMFVFATLCLLLMLAREVNYGRTLIFFADPEHANQYPKWKDLEYGWIAHLVVGLYMLWLLVYFIWQKVWKEVWEVLRTLRVPACDILLALCGLVVGVAFESLHDCLSEELGEVVMYVAAVGILYLYSRDKVRKI